MFDRRKEISPVTVIELSGEDLLGYLLLIVTVESRKIFSIAKNGAKILSRCLKATLVLPAFSNIELYIFNYKKLTYTEIT